MADALPRLAVIAGGGDLPVLLARAAHRQGRDVLVLALEPFADPAAMPEGIPVISAHLGAANRMLASLREHAIEEVVLAGRVKRPGLGDIRPDLKALGILTRASLRGLGDDGLLGLVRTALEEEGFRLVGATDIMPDIRAATGLIAGQAPDAQALADIRRGIAVVTALGSVDTGQAAVVQQGIVLAVEAIEGTDAMIARAGSLRRTGTGGVLVKLAKPGQDQQLDLPTIGPETVTQAAAAGLAGIAVSAGNCQIIDLATVSALIEHHGLFLYGLAAGELSEVADD